MKNLFLAALISAAFINPALANANETPPVDGPMTEFILSNQDEFASEEKTSADADITLLFGDADMSGQLPQDNDYIERELDKPAPDQE